jgi:hypothetical protein
MRYKWHVREGYLKIHVSVDVKKKRILSLEVTSEEVYNGKMLQKLVDNTSENNNVRCVLADGIYTIIIIGILDIYQRTILNLV